MAVATLDRYRFDYVTTPINDLQVQTETDPKTNKRKVASVAVQGEPCQPSERFWTSLGARYGFGQQIFNFFSYDEVFARIAEKQANDRVRICVERDTENGAATLRAASLPTKPVVGYDDLIDMLTRYQGQDLAYHDGVVESTHTPRTGSNNFSIAGDMFSHRFVMATPIDGYGQPNIYLSLLRLICANGMVGFAKAFCSKLSLGKGGDDVAPAITRALDGFGNDEGYAALRQRMEAATMSWASVYETNTLYALLVKMHSGRQIIGVDDPSLKRGVGLHKWATTTPEGRAMSTMGEAEDVIGSPVIRAYHTMTGDTNHLYGLANLDALSHKRQRTLPTKATVYDTINFATEVATHYCEPNGARKLNGWVGSLISGEFDMEGTRESFADFQDFFVRARLAVPELTGNN